MYFIFLILYAVSGFSLLSMETIWIRDTGLYIGNTLESASLVIAVFFLCAALGNRLGIQILKKIPKPGVVYGLGEITAAVSALVLFLMRGFVFSPLMGNGVAEYLYPFLVAGIPSCAAGISFPALAELQIKNSSGRLLKGGPLYTANLIGAAGGVLIGGLYFPMKIGYTAAFLICSIIMCVGGFAALTVSRTTGHSEKKAPLIQGEPFSTWVQMVAGFSVFLSGALSLGLEISVIHYFSLITHSSLYAVSAVFFAFILNLGIGSAAVVVCGKFIKDRVKLLSLSLVLAGCSVMLSHILFHILLKHIFISEDENITVHLIKTSVFAWIILLPTAGVVGMVFPAAWDIIKRNLSQGELFGRIFALNKVGSAIGVFAVPFILFALIGLPGTLLFSGVMYCIPGTALFFRKGKRSGLISAALCVIALIVSIVFFNEPVHTAPGETLIDVKTGPGGIVSVTKDSRGSRHIVLNHSYMLNGTDRALLSQKHEAWIPLAFHPGPERVVFVGMASGISADAVLDYNIRELEAVEIVPEVADAAYIHFGEWNSRLFSDIRASVHLEDGRHLIRSSRKPYDVIICDLFHPAREGTGVMYSRDFFEIVKRKLNVDGIFCLWLAAYQLNEYTAGIIFRTFIESFDNALIIRGNLDPVQPIIGLLGSCGPFDLSEKTIRLYLDERVPERVKKESVFLRSPVNFRTAVIGDLKSAEEDFTSVPLNTDDRPVISFEGPRKVRDGTHLRGITLLNFLGRRFLDRGFPSCTDNTESEILLKGIRAGNYCFAAAASSISLPGVSREKQIQRQLQAVRNLETARDLLPGIDIRTIDLGR